MGSEPGPLERTPKMTFFSNPPVERCLACDAVVSEGERRDNAIIFLRSIVYNRILT